MVRRRKDTNTIPGMAPPPAAEPKASVPQSVAAPKKKAAGAAPASDPAPAAPPPAAEATPPSPAPAVAPAAAAAPKDGGAAPKAAAEAAPKSKAKAQPKDAAAASAPGGGEAAQAKSKAKAAAKAPANGATSAPVPAPASAPTGAKAKAKGKAKADPKAPEPPAPAPEPTPVADEGMETVKKPRRRKKAVEMTAHELEEVSKAGAAGGVSHEEMEESTRIRSEHDRHHQDLVSIIVKEIQSVPEVSPTGLKEVGEQRRRLEEVVKQLDTTLRDAKCPRPKLADPSKILDQMMELKQCQTDETSFSDDAKEEMLAEKRTELSKAHRWESYVKFQEDMHKLREKVTKRIAANDATAKTVKSDNDKKRLASRVAQVKGVKPEEIDEGSIVSTNVDLPPEVTALSFLYRQRFEKQYGVIIDRPDGAKGMGKGPGQMPPPRSFIVHGVGGETAGCVSALRALDFSERKVMNVTAKQAASIMGSQQANARKLEKDFKGVFVHSDKNQVTFYGPTKEVKACHEHVQKGLVHEDSSKESPARPAAGGGGGERSSAPAPAPSPLIRVDNDKARAMIGANGKNVQKLESDTGTLIKVNLARREEDSNDDDAIATIRVSGDKEKVEKARVAIDAFMKNLATCLVEAPPEAVARLYDGARAAAKGAGKGKGGKAPTSRFGELRETSGLTVVRKSKGVLLLGEKADVDKWKVVLKECVEEASIAPLAIKVTGEQARLWSQERCEAMKESTGARVQLIRRGKGGDNSVLEVAGTQEEKDKAQAEIDKSHEQLGNSETIEGVVAAATRALTLKGASKLRDIEKKHDVAIVVDRKAQEIKVMGKKEAVEAARAELETAIATAGAVVTKNVDIEWEEGGIIIGKGGVTVQSIRSTTGIDDLQVETEGNKKKVVLRGSPEAVEAAVKMVQEVLEKARNTDESEPTKGKGKGKGKRTDKSGEEPKESDASPSDSEEKRPAKGKGEKGEKGEGKGDKGRGKGNGAASGGTPTAGGEWAASKRAKQEPVDVDCEALFPSLGGGVGPGATRRPAGGSAWGGGGRTVEEETPEPVPAKEAPAEEEEEEAAAEEEAAEEEESGER